MGKHLQSLFCIFLFSIACCAQDVEISFDYEDAGLAEVFNGIESLTDYTFIYNSNDLDLDKKITLKADKEELSTVLDRLFLKSQNSYQLVDKHIVVLQPVQNEEIVTLSGQLTNNRKTPLPDVTVLIDDGQKGTSTDENGHFSISALKGSKFLFYC